MTNKEVADKALLDFLKEEQNFGPNYNDWKLRAYDETWTDWQVKDRIKKAFELGQQYPLSKLERSIK